MVDSHDKQDGANSCARPSASRVQSGVRKAVRRLAVMVAGERVYQPISLENAMTTVPAKGYPAGALIRDGDRTLAVWEVTHVTPSGRRMGRWIVQTEALPTSVALRAVREAV